MRNDAYSLYLRDISRHPVLDRAEEHGLAVEYRASGRPDLARRLAHGHLRLVVKLARRYAWKRNDLLDLIEQGNIGLLLAIRRYDPDRGVRLSSFAAYWIRALILRYLATNRRLVRVGTTQSQRRVLAAMARARGALDGGAAARMGMSPDAAAALARHVGSSELVLDSPSFRSTLSSSEPGPDEVLASRQERELVREASARFAKRLSARDRAVFSARWLGDEPPSLQSLADRFDVSRERMRQIEARILRRFKDYLHARAGRFVSERAPSPSQ